MNAADTQRAGVPFRSGRLERRLRLLVSGLIRNREFHIRRDRLRGRGYLDIGCGPNPDPRFVNLDFQWRPGVDICWDVTRALPLASESMRGVFSEHCIEHLDLAAGDALLGECFRVLVPGGTLRVVTPDAEQYLTGYVAKLHDATAPDLPRAGNDAFEGVYTPAMTVSRVYCRFGHRFIWDLETFDALLARHGFVDIRRESFGNGRDEYLVHDTERRAPGSLYVEATKPAASGGAPTDCGA